MSSQVTTTPSLNSVSPLEADWNKSNASQKISDLIIRITNLLNMNQPGGFDYNVNNISLREWNHEKTAQALKKEFDSIHSELYEWSQKFPHIFFKKFLNLKKLLLTTTMLINLINQHQQCIIKQGQYIMQN